MKTKHFFILVIFSNYLFNLQANIKTAFKCAFTSKVYNWNGDAKDSNNTFIGFSLVNKSEDALWVKVANSSLSKDEAKISSDLKDKVENSNFEDALSAKNGYTHIALDTSRPTKLMIYKLLTGTSQKQLIASFNLNLKQEASGQYKTLYLTWGPLDIDRAANVQKITNQNGPNFLYPQTGTGLVNKVTQVCNSLKNNITLQELDDPCASKSINERCQIKQNNLIYEGFCAPIGTLSTGTLTCKPRKTEKAISPKSWKEEFSTLFLKAFPIPLGGQGYLETNLTMTDNFKNLNDFLNKTIFNYIDSNINRIDSYRKELFKLYSDIIKEFRDINSKWSSIKTGSAGNRAKFKLNHGLGLENIAKQLDSLKFRLSTIKAQQRDSNSKEFVDKLWILADGLNNVIKILSKQLKNI